MKKFTKKKATAKAGLTLVSYIVSSQGSAFRELPEDTDIGIDAFVEFIDKERALGLWVGLQIKSGVSYFKNVENKIFKVTLTKDDFEYYNYQTFPIALIVVEPNEQVISWLDIKKFILEHPQCLVKNNTTITVDYKVNPFNKEKFNQVFIPYFIDRYKNINNLKVSIDIFNHAAISNNINERLSGIVDLVSNETTKMKKFTIYILLHNIFNKDRNIRAISTDALSRYLPHPEVSFNAPREIRNYLREALSYFDKEEIIELLKTALIDSEDNLMQRGSLGQCVETIIIEINNFEDILQNILVDFNIDSELKKIILMLSGSYNLLNILRYISFNLEKLYYTGLFDLLDWCAELYSLSEENEYKLEQLYLDGEYAKLIRILNDSSLTYLINNKNVIERISRNCTDKEVVDIIYKTLNRIDRWIGVNPNQLSLDF